MKLTDSERKLLDALQTEGRISNQSLAERAGMSPSPCWRRVRALEETGVIRGYAALLDPTKVGLNVIAYASIQLQRYSEEEVSRFEDSVRGAPEIVECYSVMGEADYLLKIMVEDAKAYDRFLHDFIFKIPGLVQVRSSLTLREVKYGTALPLKRAGS
jgi:DNA-binding Lrp family transcriptional regulator